jgi:carotenoid cleavage dioxygenase-like enzyme
MERPSRLCSRLCDQPTEVAVEDLATTGAIPEWLEGDLLRNGPAMWRVGGRRLNHWFDGMAMLHRFSIHAGKVSYANRFLRSKDYQAAKNGSIEFAEFATDPCRSLFKRMTANFSPVYSSNANVNITKVADDFVAMTETPIQIAFNPETLDTLGVVEYEDSLTPGITTAHPHYDVTTHELINYMLKMGRNSTYTVFGIPRGSKHRQAIGTADTPRPSYMHSFALTENYIVLMEFPFVVNPLSMLLSGRPFIENYRWKPELGTTFTLFDRADGSTTRLHTDEPWFAFHHVNAYEESGQLILDVSVYADAEIVSDLFLNCCSAGSRFIRLPTATASALLPASLHTRSAGEHCAIASALRATARIAAHQLRLAQRTGVPIRIRHLR